MLWGATPALANGGHGHGHQTCEPGTLNIFAELPTEPGFPEDVVEFDDSYLVSMPAQFGWLGPSQIVQVDDETGEVIDVIELVGEPPQAIHAVVGMARGFNGEVYVNSTALGVVKLTNDGTCGGGWTQEIQSSGPWLITNPYAPSILNGIVVLPDGDLLVSDSLQNVIYRIPQEGGDAQVWFHDPTIVVTGQHQMGMNAMRLDPERENVYINYTGGPATNEFELAQNARLYRLPFVDNPTPAQLETVLELGPYDQLDAIAFDSNGDLWLSTAGTNQVLQLTDIAGAPTIVRMITDPLFNGPSNLLFVDADHGHGHGHGHEEDTNTLLIVNHAVTAEEPFDPNPFLLMEYCLEPGISGDPLP